MKYVLILLAVLFVLPALAESQVMVRSVTVKGEAERDIVPDQAHLQINLNAVKPDIKAAKAAHDAKLKQLMRIADKADIPDSHMKTQFSQTQPVYTSRRVFVPVDEECLKLYEQTMKRIEQGQRGLTARPCRPEQTSEQVLEGYRVQTRLELRVDDKSKLAGLLETINAAEFEKDAKPEWGWGNLLQLRYSVSNPSAIKDEMLSEAIVNARSKALMMAKAAQTSLGRVYQIQETGTPRFQPVMVQNELARSRSFAAADSSAIAPPAGEQRIYSSVTVTFELKD